MKRYFLLFALAFGLVINVAAHADGKDKGGSNDQVQRKSKLVESDQYKPNKTAFPSNFQEINNPRNSPAVSTGYYFVDSEEKIPDQFKTPGQKNTIWYVPNVPVDTTFEPALWRRILPGARILPKEYWNDPKVKDDGLSFFRNPVGFTDIFDQSLHGEGDLDSTDDAFAGPIPLGIRGGFYFNGLRYDSFYVTTNGLIALTNRRYFYDAQGNKVVPEGAKSAYDPMSMDWFVKGYPFGATGRCGRCRTYEDMGRGDQTRDDFGYFHSVLGVDPEDYTANDGIFNAKGGIRVPGGSWSSLKAGCKAAVIAPAWGDMHLSQYNPNTKLPEDFGKVYFKRSQLADKLIIYFVNLAPKGNLNTAAGDYDMKMNKRPIIDSNIISCDIQVTLDGNDSSVTILYKRITSDLNMGYSLAYSYSVLRRNSTCGVRGFARHTNYPQGVPETDEMYPWGGEYEQFTTYFDHYKDEPGSTELEYPKTGQAVKFKQWQNSVRVADIQYRVRDTKVPSQYTLEDFPTVIASDKADNYELLAGEPRIGAIQPVILVQNLTNDIQGPNGVNYVPQDLNFRVRFKIINQVTNRSVYNRFAPIDKTCFLVGMSDDPAERVKCSGDPNIRVRLGATVTKAGKNYVFTPEANFAGTGYNGLPPYKFVQVYFPPFEPNEFLENHIGRLKSVISAEPLKPNGDPIGDKWPFDDEQNINLFVMTRLTSFKDNGDEFHQVGSYTMPSVWKWVNIDADMKSGEDVSNNPLPPRRTEYAFLERNSRNPNINLTSPTIHLNRLTLDGTEPDPKALANRNGNGDEIRSFPINMIGKFGAVLSLSVQRSAKMEDWPRNWCDGSLIGPEPRTIENGNPLKVHATGNAASSTPDELVVEIAKPSDDGLNGITNIPDINWSVHPVRKGGKAVGEETKTKNPALTIFGAGGYQIGFLETDKDSSLSDPTDAVRNGLRANMFDDGIDFGYKKYFIAIPDTFIKWKNSGAKNFRFRIKAFCTNNQKNPAFIPDDADDFFVDNVAITMPAEIPDIEISTVKVLWPYTIAPASQATSIPIRVVVSNNSSLNAPTFSVKVRIYRIDTKGKPEKDPIYCRTENPSAIGAGQEVEVTMPAWNARKSQKDSVASYKIEALVLLPEKDLNTENDTNFTSFTLRFGEVYAYDPALEKPRSDVATYAAYPGSLAGKGLNLWASSYGGRGNYNGAVPAPWGGWNSLTDVAGSIGNGSGQLAVKFEILNTDTIRGYDAFFTGISQAPDPIQLCIYKEIAGMPGGDFNSIIPGTWIQTVRGGGQTWGFEQYVHLNLPEPVELPRGKYWAAISQLGMTGLELGGSASRMGMRTMNVYVAPDGSLGRSGTSLLLEKNFRMVGGSNQLVNNNFFAYENIRFSGSWVPFTPTIGLPAYPHKDHFGTNGKPTPMGPDVTQSLSQGSWIPMLRPYFGKRSHGDKFDEFQWCPDDIPVELSNFSGEARKNGVDLNWETASESNNYGFYLERKADNDMNKEWMQIGFVAGAGNSNTVRHYNYADNDVALNSTYFYRLRQIDKDGVHTCSYSNVIKVTFDQASDLTIDQNRPNPFTSSTTIGFNTPSRQLVKLEVLDIFGNVIKTVVNAELDSKHHEYVWDGTDDSNNLVVSGTYIYRLTSGQEVKSGKMTLVR